MSPPTNGATNGASDHTSNGHADAPATTAPPPPSQFEKPAQPPPETAQAIDDFAAKLDRRYAPIPDGRYLVEILAHDIKPFSNAWKSGVDFVVGIILGEYAGKEIPLSLTVDGEGAAQARAAHDMTMLRQWKDGLGILRASDAEHLVRELGKTARAGSGGCG